jgi:hypothetical protein
VSNLSQLVQISSGSWVNPADVKRIYTCESTMGDDPSPTITYVVCTGAGGMSLFGAVNSDHYITSDWTIERITNALGLISADALDAQFNRDDSAH